MIHATTANEAIPFLLLNPETPGGVGLTYNCTDHNGNPAGTITLERREAAGAVWSYWPATSNPSKTHCNGYRELPAGRTLDDAIRRMARTEAWNRAKTAAAIRHMAA